MRTVARDQAVARRTTGSTARGRARPGGRPDQTRTLGNQATTRLLAGVPPVVGEALSSPGQPLDLPTRRLMEPRLGYDLGAVRVHHGSLAAESAAAVHALAYTVGNDIVFGAGQYRPGTGQGTALLAHELTHVVQQRNVGTGAGARGGISGYGANIAITFTPNALVDAEQISFVQTATSVKDGVPHNKHQRTEKDRKVAEGRMIPAGKPGAGAHIDQFPHSVTPLYPGTPGWRYRDASGVVTTQDASMKDTPDLNTGDIYVAASDAQTGEWSQRFETTALATKGNQRGAYYGSVQWGWTTVTGGKQTGKTGWVWDTDLSPRP